MTIAQELETIRKQHGGILRPRQVVAFARDSHTALHERFEWDDGVAANKYRLEQARLIIRCTVKMMRDDMPPTHVYVSLSGDRQEGDSYRLLADVLRDKDHREELLKQAYEEAESWRRRYEQFDELAEIVSAIKKTQERRKQGEQRRKKATKRKKEELVEV